MHLLKVLDLPFRDDIAKPNRDNAIDVYIGDTPEDVIGDDVWAETFTRQPEPLTAAEKKEWLSHVTGVCLGSDAFFPLGDNIERARRSGVTAIVKTIVIIVIAITVSRSENPLLAPRTSVFKLFCNAYRLELQKRILISDSSRKR